MFSWYAITLDANGTAVWMASFPDLPNAHAFGRSADEARDHAFQAISTYVDVLIGLALPVPPPSTGVPTGDVVFLPEVLALRITWHNTWLAGAPK